MPIQELLVPPKAERLHLGEEGRKSVTNKKNREEKNSGNFQNQIFFHSARLLLDLGKRRLITSVTLFNVNKGGGKLKNVEVTRDRDRDGDRD